MYEGDSDIELHAVKGNRVIETRRVNYRITSLLYKSRLESNACVRFSMVNSNRLRCIFEWILGDRFVMQYHYFAEPARVLNWPRIVENQLAPPKIMQISGRILSDQFII